jgi:hypothetical protein
MPTSVRIRQMSPPTESGMVMVKVTIQSDKIRELPLAMSILAKGSPELNGEEVRGILQEFSHQLQQALQQLAVVRQIGRISHGVFVSPTASFQFL